MNWLDLVFILLIIASFAGGWGRGLVRQAFDTGGFLLGVYLAGRYFTDAAGFFLHFIEGEALGLLLGFLAVLIITQIAVSILASILFHTAQTPAYGSPDRFFGALLGLVQGFLVVLLFSLLILNLVEAEFLAVAVRESAIAEVVVNQFNVLAPLLPDVLLR